MAGRIISYCIPVMNRSDDLKETLPVNLHDNRRHQDKVEFVVVCFDTSDVLVTYLHQNFAAEIASGFLRVHTSTALKRWHSRSRNEFRNLIGGSALYSSLDADNFVSGEMTDQILGLYDRFGQRMIIHYFSGVWGDGTCGRVTLGADLFRKVGFDPSFLPRQFDEVDLILSVLKREPGIPYLSCFPGGILKKSRITSAFTQAAGIEVANEVIERPPVRAPLNPKAPDYGSADRLMDAMGRFNRAISFAKLSDAAGDKVRHMADATRAAYSVLDAAGPEGIDLFLSEAPGSPKPGEPVAGVPVFTCVKDEKWLLEEWYRHYRSLGCGPFFIVDDHSSRPAREVLPYFDVHVFHPEAGTFRTCKAVWVKALMQRYLSEGQWALTVDADEFLDVPDGVSVAEQLRVADEAGKSVLPGILVDLLPDSEQLTPGMPIDGREVIRIFNRHLFADGAPWFRYALSEPIKWAFGRNWQKSYFIDARHHLFGTIDVLRKVPLTKHRSGTRLSQGFHDLTCAKNPKGLSSALWAEPALPIRHYKLAKLFGSTERGSTAARATRPYVYHERTTANMARMLSDSPESLLSRISQARTIRYDPDLFGRTELDVSTFRWRLRNLIVRAVQALRPNP